MKAKLHGPVDALDYAIHSAFVMSRRPRPGEVIAGLGRETRELLRELTSDQARSMRSTMLSAEPTRDVRARFRHAVEVAGGRV